MAGESGWSWFTNGKNLQGLGSVVGAAGSIYGGIEQSKASNKMIDLSRDEYNFNKDLILEDEKRKKRQEDAYAQAYGSGVVAL